MKTTMIPSKRRTARVFAPASQPSQSKAKTLQIRNVLVATDFSRRSIQAFQAALPLIKQFGAELHLIHVLTHDPIGGLINIPLVLSEAELREHARHRLHQIATKYSVPLRPKNACVPHGNAFEQICQVARDLKIDLIVIATRGQTGLKHLLLGSTAERVVRYAPCPVLVVRPRGRFTRNGQRPEALLRIKKILVPIDFSKCSQKGFNYARAVSARLGSELVLMHSICPAYYVANDEYARYDFPELLRHCEADAAKKMHELASGARRSAMQIDIPNTFGHAGQQICCRAEKLGVDLIVTSTHGRTGLKHVLLGSTAEYVVRHAPCSVLVVPSHPRPTLNSTEDTK